MESVLHQWETELGYPDSNNHLHIVAVGNSRDLHIDAGDNNIAVMDNNSDAEEDSNIGGVDDSILHCRD